MWKTEQKGKKKKKKKINFIASYTENNYLKLENSVNHVKRITVRIWESRNYK